MNLKILHYHVIPYHNKFYSIITRFHSRRVNELASELSVKRFQIKIEKF